jgi:hypothetical protein
VVVLAACGEATEPTSAPPKIPVVTGQQVDHAAAKEGAFDSLAFPCCGSVASEAVVLGVVALGDALASDDAAAAAGKAAALRSSLATAVTDSAVDAETRPLLETMAALADRMDGQDLEGMREEFLDLSTPALAFAAHNTGGDTAVAVAFCPMKPGRWMQTSKTIANPYYGASMLTCGVFEAPAKPGPAGE